MIKKGICQVFNVKNCDEKKILHIILNGGSTWYMTPHRRGKRTSPKYKFWPISGFAWGVLWDMGP